MARKRKTRQGTIFDDIFRTMAQKTPELFVPIINEMFGKHYDVETVGEQLRNEHMTKKGKRITDSAFRIGDTIYHIECQSAEDGTIALRMFEYDFQIALDEQRRTKDFSRMVFPCGGVLYLRPPAGGKRDIGIEVIFPDGQKVMYRPQVLYATDYGLKEIFAKNLLLLLPYYMLRYEKQFAGIAADAMRTQKFLAEYQEIATDIQSALTAGKNDYLYTDLAQAIRYVARYLLDGQEKLKKGVENIMGGRILPTYSDILRRKEKKALEKGKMEGIFGIVRRMLQNRKPYDEIASDTGVGLEEIRQLAEQEGLAY